MSHRTTAEIEAALDEREVLEAAEVSIDEGLVGDTWRSRGSSRSEDGSAHRDIQLNIMNIRFAQFIAGEADRIPLAGDQLYVDFDLSDGSLPPWTKLSIGSAVIETTDQPHTGCAKSTQRFGLDALRFVNSPVGTALHLRGINARVVEPGTIRVGDAIVRL